jgi:3-hydroxyacyl-CoA dehydrogenase
MLMKSVKKVAVLGSGVMGSRIALHFAGCGVQVLLLDMLSETSENGNSSQRNKIVNEALAATLQSTPSSAYTKETVKSIATGNFIDDLPKIAQCDWIIEVIVESVSIKQQLYQEVEKYRKAGTLVTTNTSGIPIHLLTEGRSEDFKKNFCGTHFFNPPRYLRLLEIIPTPHTDIAVTEFLMQYGDLHLGKTTVLCKDTPAFIANRIGVFSIMTIIHLMESMNLSIDEIDALTGPVIGRPKSATFRTADVVGLDTLVKVAEGVRENCLKDEARDSFTVPEWLKQMIEKRWLGDKTGRGFFKKTKSATGEKSIKVLNVATLEYEERKKSKFASIDTARQNEDLISRLKFLIEAEDKAGAFYRNFHYALFAYITHRIPEISDEIYRIDDALKAGFGWELGAFETWDAFGLKMTADKMKAAGFTVADWFTQMIEGGFHSFYKTENGTKKYYDITTQNYKAIPGGKAFLVMKDFVHQTLWKNSNCRLYHLGEDVLGLEWNTKMGTIGGEVLEGLQSSIGIAEEKYKGLVIANEGANFSAGANIGLIFMLAIEQEFDELDMAIRMFQNSMMRVRYSSVPVVIAPHNLALGGGCEMSLHADAVIASAETYTGLVETGIGVIPGGGGTKEFILRASKEMHNGEPETITLQNRFLTIATAKVSTSAAEAYELGIYRKGTDLISINSSRRISRAKEKVLELYNNGYSTPIQQKDTKVLGRSAMGAIHAGINGMWRAQYASEHDVKVAKKLAYVMCGGDLSQPTEVSEQYLLDLEREAFLSLCSEKKTLERIQHILKTGKPLRN